MNTKVLGTILVVGALASMPAYAWQWNNATYAARHGGSPVQPGQSTVASAQPTSGQETTDAQVAVMAKSPSQSTASNSGADEWYGTDQHARAIHSH
jgi:cytoskeletal protein RodZ